MSEHMTATTTTTTTRPSREQEAAEALALIERIIEACPRRHSASESERRAQGMVAEALAAVGDGELRVELEPFTFNVSIFSNLAAHFGLGLAGSVVARRWPAAALALHLISGVSYLLDSSRRAFVLRRLQRFRPSVNVVATAPAREAAALRLVFVSHTDAAFTGWLFSQRFVEAFGNPGGGVLRRPLALATWAQLAQAALDLARVVSGRALRGLRGVELALSTPALIATVLNAQIVLRDEVVPGANDNLSGVAGNVLLARRLLATQRPDVEYVFASTGCEEASLGGAQALARRARDEGRWDPARTVIIGLDGLSNGALRYFDEGEVVARPVAPWLREVIAGVAASEPRFAGVGPYQIPVGATDVYAFTAQGYDGACLGCVDLALGTPRHYHQPSDRPENLEPAAIVTAVDFAEALTQAIIDARLGG